MSQFLVLAILSLGQIVACDRDPVNFPPAQAQGGFASGSVGARPPPGVAGAPPSPGIIAGPLPAPPGPFGPPPGSCYAGFQVRKARTGRGNIVDSRSSSGRIFFQDVLLNMGGWSSSLSDFWAPCDGVYYFSFHAVSPQTQDFTLQLMKNNQYQVTAYGGGRDYQQASNSALLTLKRGDLVHLQLTDGTIYEHPNNEAYTSFNGYLVLPF